MHGEVAAGGCVAVQNRKCVKQEVLHQLQEVAACVTTGLATMEAPYADAEHK